MLPYSIFNILLFQLNWNSFIKKCSKNTQHESKEFEIKIDNMNADQYIYVIAKFKTVDKTILDIIEEKFSVFHLLFNLGQAISGVKTFAKVNYSILRF